MDNLNLGFFFDSARRDHAWTLLALEDAYRRAKTTEACFRADAEDETSASRRAAGLYESPVAFDALALDLEFADHPALADALFLIDYAPDVDKPPLSAEALDRIACLPRVAALDVSALAFFRVLFNRDIPLLPAPLAPVLPLAGAPARRVALVIHDLALARAVGADLRRALARIDPHLEIVELARASRAPTPQSAWLAAELHNTLAHVHIGAPADSAAFGRLIDTMNFRAPCVVFEPARLKRDGDVELKWRRPDYQADVNLVWTSSLKAFSEAAAGVLRDRAFAEALVRNGLSEVALFHEQVQNSLLPLKFAETYGNPS